MDKFCPYQEKTTIYNFNGEPKQEMICGISPAKNQCPYKKPKKAITKCQDFKRSQHD